MLHSPSSALRPLLTNTAIVIRLNTAVVLRVAIGDIGVATDTWGLIVCTNAPAHIMIIRIAIGTLHVVVADDLTLHSGGVGGTVLRTLVITRL